MSSLPFTCVFSVLVLFQILFHLLISCTWFKMALYTQPSTSYAIQPFSSQNSLGKTNSLFRSANYKKKSNLLLLTPWFVSLRLRCILCLFSGGPERGLSWHPYSRRDGNLMDELKQHAWWMVRSMGQLGHWEFHSPCWRTKESNNHRATSVSASKRQQWDQSSIQVAVSL